MSSTTSWKSKSWNALESSSIPPLNPETTLQTQLRMILGQSHLDLTCDHFKAPCNSSLTGVALLVGHHSTKQKVPGSIPSQGTGLCCGFNPRLGSYERHPIDIFPPFFLSPSLPLSLKINK